MDSNLLPKILTDVETDSKLRFTMNYTGWYLIGSPVEKDDKGISYQTNVIDSATIRSLIESSHDSELAERFVLEIRKKPANAFPDWITLGRATNNDLVVRYPSVSKLHARLEVERSTAGDPVGYRLVNGSSAAKTVLNGKPLSSGQSPSIRFGDTILFGKIKCIVANAELLWDRFWG